MPDNQVIQFGSFGLVVFVVLWIVLRGFPQAVDVIRFTVTNTLAAAATMVDRALIEIKTMDTNGRTERQEMIRAFREELELQRKADREDSDADRRARHDQGVLYQRSLVELTDMGALKQQARKPQSPQQPPPQK